MRIHWFSFTVHASPEVGRSLWKRHFFHSLGALISSERKGRGFDNIDVALNEAKFYYNPIQSKKEEGEKIQEKKEYFHIEIPGLACDCLVPTIFQDVVRELSSSGLRWTVKRIDLAWDNVPFMPIEFCNAIARNYAVTLAKRETLSMVQSPFQMREDASGFGCDTCYIGSKESQRFIRVYNQRGFNRLEFVCRDERAHVVALDLFEYHYQDWDFVGREHLVQYITFKEEFSQWHVFINNAQSADIKISSARVVSLSKMEEWYIKSVVVSWSVYEDVWGRKEAKERFEKLVNHARATRDRSRYSAVLQLAG